MPTLEQSQLEAFEAKKEQRWILRLRNAIKRLFSHRIGHLSDEELYAKTEEVFYQAKELGFRDIKITAEYVQFCVGIFPDYHLDEAFNAYLREQPEEVEDRFMAVVSVTKFEMKLQLDKGEK